MLTCACSFQLSVVCLSQELLPAAKAAKLRSKKEQQSDKARCGPGFSPPAVETLPPPVSGYSILKLKFIVLSYRAPGPCVFASVVKRGV